MSDSEFDLEISRLLAAPRARIWRAWSDPKILTQWWCPKPWTTEVLAFDMRPGGGFHTCMSGPSGEKSDNPGCFLEIVPEQRIVFTTSLIAGWRPFVPWLAITAIFTMKDEGTSTRYTARALHKDADDSTRHKEMGFDEGWGICITQLEEVARNLP